MSDNTDSIIIVGGGSAGWMTAATLITQFPNKKITVIESPNIPIIGVGESTVAGIRPWLRMIGVEDKEFLKATDGTYKLAIRFNDFYKKDGGTWYYPFGPAYLKENKHRKNDWFIKKALFPNTPSNDYAECFYPQMALIKSNKLMVNDGNLGDFQFYEDSAFNFDAIKFGAWLRDNVCIPRGVNHIVDEVKTINQNDSGIDHFILESGQTASADLYIDCTGFTALLIDKTLHVPFKSYEEVLPNNRAWAVQVPYRNKEEQINSVTDCTAIDNGWVWEITLWSRIGTGYVYCDKYITPEQAKEDFKKHLIAKGHNIEGCNFRDLKMRVGIHERLWEKNVVAIGLSAAFLEPLESTGLITIHQYLTNLCRILRRDKITQWDKDEFTMKCEDEFNYWTQFVAMHYSLSCRDDTDYWRDIGKKSHVKLFQSLNNMQTQSLYHQSIYSKSYNHTMQDDVGINCVTAGMNWIPIDEHVLNSSYGYNSDWRHELAKSIEPLEERKQRWLRAVETAPSVYEYLKRNFYD